MKHFIRAAIAASGLASASCHAAATLIVSNGILTGATGVVVGSQTYNVTFADGTCAAVYGSCTVDAFDFTTEADATAAGQALLDQVFTDGTAGNFDSVTTNIFGCSSASSCGSLIAFQTKASPASFRSAFAVNRSGAGLDQIQITDLSLTGNYANVTTTNFARFTLPSASVPEPASWAMMLTGFGLLGAALRRGNRRVRFA